MLTTSQVNHATFTNFTTFTALPTGTRSHQTTDINKAGTLQMVISSPFSIGLEALTNSLRSLQHVWYVLGLKLEDFELATFGVR